MEKGFAKGFVLGGLLTTAFVVGFEINREGQSFTEKLKKYFSQLTKYLKENCDKPQEVTKEDFDELITVVVEDYAKKKEIGDDSKNTLMEALKSKWSEIKHDYTDKG